MSSVPLDPDNLAASDGDPRGGRQYVYFLEGPGGRFLGGLCAGDKKRWVYLLGITDLRSEVVRPPRRITGSGCECLWRDQPDFFQSHFDYVICGTFDADASRARAAEARAKRDAAAVAEKEAEAVRLHGAEDQRRVADLRKIQQGLETYLKDVGPLPAPREYGEADGLPGFWQGYWDLSTADRDGDGKKFLDFLVERGTMPAVPLDPDNEAAKDGGDPTNGRQYVYFLISPNESFEGGSCGRNEWVYMLGITDLRSELGRPPKRIPGSGCECLWRKKPRFFEQHFDYVICGTFTMTPEDRSHAE
jgi:hypothetical protein